MNAKQTASDKAIERLNLIARICTRAEEMGIRRGSRITAQMDVDLAAEHFNLRLADWLNADAFNFAHDFIEIQNHIDRANKTFDNRFLPRFAGKKEDALVTEETAIAVTVTADTRAIDGWVQGIVTDGKETYEFCAKVFDEKSIYGINNGRVSKLGVRYKTTPIINYDKAGTRKDQRSQVRRDGAGVMPRQAHTRNASILRSRANGTVGRTHRAIAEPTAEQAERP